MTAKIITSEMQQQLCEFLDIANDHVLDAFEDNEELRNTVLLITKAISTCKEGFAIVPIEDFEKIYSESLWLSCLEASGVDNWGGCDDAKDMYNELYSNWQL